MYISKLIASYHLASQSSYAVHLAPILTISLSFSSRRRTHWTPMFTVKLSSSSINLSTSSRNPPHSCGGNSPRRHTRTTNPAINSFLPAKKRHEPPSCFPHFLRLRRGQWSIYLSTFCQCTRTWGIGPKRFLLKSAADGI